MPTDVADSGPPEQYIIHATAEPREFKFEHWMRTLSLRNVGGNAVWFSFDRRHWFHVPAGTSWDDRVVDRSFWYKTQTGATRVEVLGTKLELFTTDLDSRIAK